MTILCDRNAIFAGRNGASVRCYLCAAVCALSVRCYLCASSETHLVDRLGKGQRTRRTEVNRQAGQRSTDKQDRGQQTSRTNWQTRVGDGAAVDAGVRSNGGLASSEGASKGATPSCVLQQRRGISSGFGQLSEFEQSGCGCWSHRRRAICTDNAAVCYNRDKASRPAWPAR